jgi:hypothetical protein
MIAIVGRSRLVLQGRGAFTPTSAGEKQATLQLVGAPGGTDSVLLTGSGL